jgi:hypothetical protein
MCLYIRSEYQYRYPNVYKYPERIQVPRTYTGFPNVYPRMKYEVGELF